MYRVFVYSQICEDAMHTIIEIKLILQKTMHLLYNIIHNILYDCAVADIFSFLCNLSSA